ncbi:hypothetical protein [Sagittula sp. MA-2]|jgi:hypothetical protein|uniref:hypothetical protein n=1 Tax=Sagittula sp. MA-2 TaxID=3048007 RepID=UPI0024C3A331|nr:hypothetical protein [Sagittula sp. MA-2]WHZ34494.1 hypothetical protein QNI11_17890 [Sagittula sp. MA-2]
MTAARRRTDIATTAMGFGLRHPTGRSGPAVPRTVQAAPGLAGTQPRGPLRLSAVAAVGIASGSAASFLRIKV